MILNKLLPFFGYSELNDDLAKLLEMAGGNIDSLSRKTLRVEGSDAIELKAIGLELAFREREGYERKFATPKDSGEAILAAVFAYGAGSKTYAPYEGPIPFGNGKILNRSDALREFGVPIKTEKDEDNDAIEWDQWLKEGLQLRSSYRDDG